MAEPEQQQDRRSQKPALLVLGAIAVVLLGFAAGILVGNPLGQSRTEPGAVDVGFSQDMSVHHAQAVQMSGVALAGTTDPDVKRLSYDILTTQANQAGRMQGWLQLWDKPLIAPDGYMGWMTDMSSHHQSGTAAHSGAVQTMPGMATEQELTALRGASGPALDTLFLQLMLRHHQGGLPMIEYAAQRADTDAVRSLADSMVKTQTSEADLMTKMLAARGASPLPL
ncbi:DUF305 domain-containing protein [Nocardia jejuensis]|uniref:DUF305 domain-containing protein n=1 Tax=Nocardia jejuensis TaxID=328049 RepID=UPI0008320B8A|nr:DUF305 domain-containing protein [Nocardia jejuensis]